ncbi:hypothetical protein [Phascolarctobacterium faecium]|jgi:septal ring factor EnvC (AmiA/AmiB activator)|uniref:hypothetical protein n=1 Tax=Phascolarctobacterium faecium TaxID=33025 RepID=UPI00205BCD8C|nr:MAG TPA: protein of unknown function (DUF5412) [Bacteriophage sp.]
MNRKNKAIMIAILAFSLLYWYFSAFLSTCSAAEVSAVEAPETITISRAQYNELKTIISEQGQRLTEFETNLQLLEQSSPELIATLNGLRVSHDRMQKRLEAAEKYSNEAKLLISEQNRSLQKLSEQIKHQQKVQRRRDIQNSGWGTAVGFVIAKVIDK